MCVPSLMKYVVQLHCPSGTRHPFLAKYKVGFTQQGKVTALDVELYNNAGNHFYMLSV